MLYALMSISYDGDRPLAIYSDRAKAEVDARALEDDYARTNPAFSDWCNRRWKIVEVWRRSGKLSADNLMRLPSDEQEQEIVAMIGKCPGVKGHESCDVWEVEDKTDK